MINKTLTKNMPNVKWDQLPPLRGAKSTRRIKWQNYTKG